MLPSQLDARRRQRLLDHRQSAVRDRAAKLLATTSSSSRQTVVDQYVDLSLQYNEGTAFSFVRDLGLARLVFGIFSILVVIALFVVVVRHPQHRWRALGFGVVAGGALGNGLDRIFRDGVVDFIVVHYPWGGSWPTFNIADVLVAVGVAILLIEGIATRTRPPAGAAGATG